jgi:hypothetical protein
MSSYFSVVINIYLFLVHLHTGVNIVQPISGPNYARLAATWLNYSKLQHYIKYLCYFEIV